MDTVQVISIRGHVRHHLINTAGYSRHCNKTVIKCYVWCWCTPIFQSDVWSQSFFNPALQCCSPVSHQLHLYSIHCLFKPMLKYIQKEKEHHCLMIILYDYMSVCFVYLFVFLPYYCLGKTVLVSHLVGPPLCVGLKYLNHRWMDRHEI